MHTARELNQLAGGHRRKDKPFRKAHMRHRWVLHGSNDLLSWNKEPSFSTSSHCIVIGLHQCAESLPTASNPCWHVGFGRLESSLYLFKLHPKPTRSWPPRYALATKLPSMVMAFTFLNRWIRYQAIDLILVSKVEACHSMSWFLLGW